MKITMAISTKNKQIRVFIRTFFATRNFVMNFKTFSIFIKSAVFTNITSFVKNLFSLIVGKHSSFSSKSTFPIRIVITSPVFLFTFIATKFSYSLVISFLRNIKHFFAFKAFEPIYFLFPLSVFMSYFLYSNKVSFRGLSFIKHNYIVGH